MKKNFAWEINMFPSGFQNDILGYLTSAPQKVTLSVT